MLIALGLFLDTPPQAATAQSIEIDNESNGSEIRSSSTITLYLPIVAKSTACPSLITETYGTVAPISAPTDRPAENHADLNLALRSYISTTAYLGLVDYGGDTDPLAPQLAGLFSDNRTPTFRRDYQVYGWDWTCNCRSTPITDWPVTLTGLLVTPTETIHLPNWGYNIGHRPNEYAAMVLYASTNRITFTFTRNDNVAQGYALHLENICVEPRLLALYQSMNAAGRTQLPAINAGQGIGTVIGNELGVAIRDTGSFMDPRSRKDWWQGR